MFKLINQNQKSEKLSTYSKVIYAIIIIFFSFILYEQSFKDKALDQNKNHSIAVIYNIGLSSGLSGKKIFEYYYFVKNIKYTTYDFLDNYDLKVNDSIPIIYDKTNPKTVEVIFDHLPIK